MIVFFELWWWRTPFSLRASTVGTAHVVVVVVSVLHSVSSGKSTSKDLALRGHTRWATLQRPGAYTQSGLCMRTWARPTKRFLQTNELSSSPMQVRGLLDSLSLHLRHRNCMTVSSGRCGLFEHPTGRCVQRRTVAILGWRLACATA